MRHSDRCRLHLDGSKRDAVDELRYPRLERRARAKGKPVQAVLALKALAAIKRRRLHRAWLTDPTVPGTTLVLTPNDEARVAEALLLRFGADLYDETHTERCRDRLKWAAFRSLAGADPIKASYRVKAALRDDERWRRRLIPETDRSLP